MTTTGRRGHGRLPRRHRQSALGDAARRRSGPRGISCHSCATRDSIPSCDRGHVNLYQPFLERCLSLARPGGRVGLVLPWGLAADEGAASLRHRLLRRDRVDTIMGLDNAAGLFPIHRGLRFMAIVVRQAGTAANSCEVRRAHAVEIDGLPAWTTRERPHDFPTRLNAATMKSAGGAALRIPDARIPPTWIGSSRNAANSRRSATVGMARQIRPRAERDRGPRVVRPRGLPVIEGKHIEPFRVSLGRRTVRIPQTALNDCSRPARVRAARLAYRDVAGVSNRLTLIAAIVPAGVVTTHTVFCLRRPCLDEQQRFLCALFNSSSLNRMVRC